MNSPVHGPSHGSLAALKAALAARAGEVAPVLLPFGKREGHYWVAGDITGAPGKSFKVCLSGAHAGSCKDWAGHEKACSLIDVCMAVRGCDFRTAVAACAELVGMRAPVMNGKPPAAPGFPWDRCR